MKIVERYMMRAMELAQLGLGKVSPNPMVGCVIVRDEKIVGEGYHREYGGAHAEVNAVNSVDDKTLLRGAKVLVNLEPCPHQGKTPPCADLLIKHDVKEVIVSNIDPNPLVNGRGIEKLRGAGIKVMTGILEDEGKDINKRYFSVFQHRRPYLILKWAETADGFIARENFDSKWISDQYARKLVHKWRYEEDAILVGANTARYDNPQLNVRDWDPEKNNGSATKDPVRIIIDKELKLKRNLKLFQGKQETLCFNTVETRVVGATKFIRIPNENGFLQQVMQHLADLRIQSVIIEGGAITLNRFIEEKLWDEARIFKAPLHLQGGIKAPKIEGRTISENKVVNDTLIIIKNAASHG